MYRPLLLSLVLVIALIFGITTAAAAQTIRIEAEDVFAFQELGGLSVYVHACSAASGGLAVDGLDRVGEWIKIRVELDTGICFVDEVRSAGAIGTQRTFAVRFEDAGSGMVWAEDILVTPPGSGIT